MAAEHGKCNIQYPCAIECSIQRTVPAKIACPAEEVICCPAEVEEQEGAVGHALVLGVDVLLEDLRHRAFTAIISASQASAG